MQQTFNLFQFPTNGNVSLDSVKRRKQVHGQIKFQFPTNGNVSLDATTIYIVSALVLFQFPTNGNVSLDLPTKRHNRRQYWFQFPTNGNVSLDWTRKPRSWHGHRTFQFPTNGNVSLDEKIHIAAKMSDESFNSLRTGTYL